jgi:tRNA pseudouridine38-40 synthase
MNKIKLVLGYLGERYNGWQIQNKQLHTKTVQYELQKALQKITGEDIKVIGGGRTDTGVNALGQVAAFTTNSTIPSHKYPHALNSVLPDDIIVFSGEKVDPNFHPVRDALGKWYRYSIFNDKFPHVFYNKVTTHISYRLNLDLMAQGAELIKGTHDFRSFCSVKTSVKNYTRTIKECSISSKNRFVFIDIYADGFLYNMVRIIAGTLIEIGRGKKDPNSIIEIINAKDRKKAGPTAEAKGLCLMKIDYSDINEKYFCNDESLDMPVLFY